MREIMTVVGSRIVDAEYTMLTLVPLNKVKKKKPLMDFGLSNLEELVSDLGHMRPHETQVFVKNDFLDNNHVKMGSHITVELTVGELE